MKKIKLFELFAGYGVAFLMCVVVFLHFSQYFANFPTVSNISLQRLHLRL